MFFFFFFKQKTAYELRISDWSSDVCSSDLNPCAAVAPPRRLCGSRPGLVVGAPGRAFPGLEQPGGAGPPPEYLTLRGRAPRQPTLDRRAPAPRSEEHTSELQSLMRITYAVFCLTKQQDTRIIT